MSNKQTLCMEFLIFEGDCMFGKRVRRTVHESNKHGMYIKYKGINLKIDIIPSVNLYCKDIKTFKAESVVK